MFGKRTSQFVGFVAWLGLLSAGCTGNVMDGEEVSTEEAAWTATGVDQNLPLPLPTPFKVMEVCDKEFRVTEGTSSRALLYCANRNLQMTRMGQPVQYRGYRRLVISQHGRGGDAKKYWESMHGVAKAVGADRETMIVAPQLLDPAELSDDYAGTVGFDAKYHFRWGSNWPLGGLSVKSGAADFSRSSFTLLDSLIQAAIERLPDLEQIVVVGQSAGGQLVNRYAMSNDLPIPAGVKVRYIPMNPQSWLYLDATRPFPEVVLEGGGYYNGDIDLWKACPNFNEYWVGLEKLSSWSYFSQNQLTPAKLISRYKEREVVYMVGEKDTEPPEDGHFVCRFAVQGKHRNERAKEYFAHVKQFYAPLALNHFFAEVSGSPHGHSQMFNSSCGKRWIFDHASPCP